MKISLYSTTRKFYADEYITDKPSKYATAPKLKFVILIFNILNK